MSERTPVVNGGSGNRIELQSGDTVAQLTRGLFNDVSDVSSNADPTVLATNSVIANTFISNGGMITARYFGTMVASANERALTLKFGGTTISTQLYDTSTSSTFEIDAQIIRESSSAVKCYVTIYVPQLYPYSTYTRITGLSLTSTAYNLELSANQTSNNDVVFKFSKINYTPGI